MRVINCEPLAWFLAGGVVVIRESSGSASIIRSEHLLATPLRLSEVVIAGRVRRVWRNRAVIAALERLFFSVALMRFRRMVAQLQT